MTIFRTRTALFAVRCTLLFFIFGSLICTLAKDGVSVEPGSLIFEAVGSSAPITRTVEFRPGGSSTTTYAVTVSTTSGGSWLTASPASLSGNVNLSVTATPGALAAGTYSGKVTITPSTAGANAITIPATLRVSSGMSGSPAMMVIRPDELEFTMTAGGSNPASRVVNLSAGNGMTVTPWTASAVVTAPAGGNWLSVTPAAGTGNATLTVAVNGTNLSAGKYLGYIQVTGGSLTTRVPVELEVRGAGSTNNNALNLDPRAFNFIVNQNSAAPAPRTLRVNNGTASSAAWTAKATSSGWLSITPTSGTGAGVITLTVNASGLTEGMYEGSVEVTSNGTTQSARVFLRVVGSGSGGGNGNGGDKNPNESAVQFAPRVVEFTSPVGGPISPASTSVQLTSKTSGLTFTEAVSTASGGNWLSVTPSSGAVPGTLTVTANPSGLAAGIYTGLITVKVAGSVAETRLIPVRLVVGSVSEDAPKLTVKPGGVALRMTQGGTAPSPVTVNVTPRNAASIPFSATVSTQSGGDWLAVSPATATAPATLTVSTKNTASMAVGVYRGTVILQATGTPGALPGRVEVLLAIRSVTSTSNATPHSLQGIFLEPSEDFSGRSHEPEAVRVAIFREDGSELEGADVQLQGTNDEHSLHLENNGNGEYSGLYTALQAGSVALNAFVSSQDGIASFSTGGDISTAARVLASVFNDGVVNGANFSPAPAPLASGSIASLFGRDLVDTSSSATSLPLPRTLSGVKVLMGGIEAPLLSATSGDTYDQINFQVPTELRGLNTADLVVVKDNSFSSPVAVAMASAAPGIFARNAAGSGVAAALHSDYSPISADKPAKAGETILLFATGLGAVDNQNPSGEAGKSGRVTGSISVRIDGVSATVQYAGIAPGYAGLYQLNVVVPSGASTGSDTLQVTVNGVSSGTGVTLPVSK